MPPTKVSTSRPSLFGKKTKISPNGIKKTYPKRKAECSPPKAEANVKRSAFGDITNATEKAAVAGKENIVDKSKITVPVTRSKISTGVRLQPLNDKKVQSFIFPKVYKTARNEKETTTTTTKVSGSKIQTKTITVRRASSLSIKKKESVAIAVPKNAVKKSLDSIKEKGPVSLKDILKPVEKKVEKKLETLTEEKESCEVLEDTADKTDEPKQVRRSCRLSTKSSVGSGSLYMSALEDTTEDKDLKTRELSEFDKECLNDPFQVSLFAMDIFDYLKSRENHFKVDDYMPRQVGVTEVMRSMLVDWMVEVQESFELNHETLYLAVKMLDLYLSRCKINKEKLQLVGATALLVSSKYDERMSPLLDDFIYICDNAYNQTDVLLMEQQLLIKLKFELGAPISYRFLRRYARCARVQMPLLTLARYILELSLTDYKSMLISDSKQAAASFYIALRMMGHGGWTDSMVYYSGYKLEDIKDAVLHFNNMLHSYSSRTDLTVIKTKYSHKVFFEVAKTALKKNDELFD